MKKYNDEMKKYKGIYTSPYTMLKAYIFSVFMALIITLPAYLILLNVIFISHYFKIILGLMMLTSLVLVYLILYFKDKYLIINIDEAKDVNLLYIRLIDIMIIAVFIAIIYFLYVLIF